MNPITLPDSLVSQLRAYEARLRKMETRAAVAGGLVGFFTAFVLLFVFDRFVDTPRWARFILALSAAGLMSWFAHAWARHWLWNRRGPAELATLLQRRFKSLGDRLQGVIELTETENLPANISPALMRAAIRQVAEESGRFDFAQAIPVKTTHRWVLAASILTALAVLPFILFPKAATNTLARFFAPWSQIERYTFASLEDLPAELVVPHGEAFDLACGLKADSAWKPSLATAKLGRNEPQQAKLQEGRAVFRLLGQTQNETLTVRIGDASRDLLIRPLHRPEIKELAAQVTLPDYLGYPDAALSIQGSSVEILEGSSVRFAAKTSRTLKEAAMKSGQAHPAAEVQEENFLTPSKALRDLGTDATFSWTDLYGLTPTQPYRLNLTVGKDSEPRVELKGLEQETAILASEVLKVSLTSSDDYGLKEAWFGWSVRGLTDKKELATQGQTAHTEGGQKKKELNAAAEFSPLWEKIPEDSVVELAAYSTDYLPGRKPVESWKHTIYVLSTAKHAERVRDRMDAILKQLDDRLRDEERQLEETTALAEAQKETGKKNADDIKRLEASERTNKEAMDKMTQEMGEVMKDALRNKDIPADAIADWKKLTDKLEKEATPPMEKAAEALEKAAEDPQESSGGEQGEPGEQGEQGKKEEKGEKGEKGDKAEKAEPEKKDKGPEAEKEKGEAEKSDPEKGESGEKGEKGESGEKGQKGPKGQKGDKSEKKLAEAKEEQKKALDALRKAANEMTTANENLTARNFFKRLKAIAETEKRISGSLSKVARETAGLTAEAVAEDKLKTFDQVAGTQDGATQDVDSIINDLRAFVKRINNEKYATVHQQMAAYNVVADLNDLATQVRKAMGLKSILRSKRWGEQFELWAAMLQNEAPPPGPPGEPSEMDPDLMELMVQLMRAAQAEDNIREQTQLLERKDPSAPKPTEGEPAPADPEKFLPDLSRWTTLNSGTMNLSTQQEELRATLAGIRSKTKFQDVVPLLEAVEGIMKEVAGNLRQTRTDAGVVADEGAIIELLVPADSKSPDQPPPPGGTMAKIQQMMQQMGKSEGKMGGGNDSTAESAFAGQSTKAPAGRDPNNTRLVDKASGANNAGEWPEEFRDQLQAYFQQLEAGGK